MLFFPFLVHIAKNLFHLIWIIKWIVKKFSKVFSNIGKIILPEVFHSEEKKIEYLIKNERYGGKKERSQKWYEIMQVQRLKLMMYVMKVRIQNLLQ